MGITYRIRCCNLILILKIPKCLSVDIINNIESIIISNHTISIEQRFVVFNLCPNLVKLIQKNYKIIYLNYFFNPYNMKIAEFVGVISFCFVGRWKFALGKDI